MDRHACGRSGGFSLLEMMVATSVLTILVGVMFTVITQTGNVIATSSSRIEAFQSARAAFESMTRNIAQATLNTYYDYFDNKGNAASDPSYNGIPYRYGRQSELHFICGKSLLPDQIGHALFFQAPLGNAGQRYKGMKSLLNACGYFVRFGSDGPDQSLSGRPDFLDAASLPLRYRFQLMEFSQPAEDFAVYGSPADPTGWFTAPLSQTVPPSARVIAENIVLLLLSPKLPDWEAQSIGEEYEYDSRTRWDGTGTQPIQSNQVCPLIKVCMVAIDERSAIRIQGKSPLLPDLGYTPDELFRKRAELDKDLAEVETALVDRRINYRIFQTEISLPAARWSNQ